MCFGEGEQSPSPNANRAKTRRNDANQVDSKRTETKRDVQ